MYNNESIFFFELEYHEHELFLLCFSNLLKIVRYYPRLNLTIYYYPYLYGPLNIIYYYTVLYYTIVLDIIVFNSVKLQKKISIFPIAINVCIHTNKGRKTIIWTIFYLFMKMFENPGFEYDVNILIICYKTKCDLLNYYGVL